jgi:hypothetical protein
MKPKKIKRLQHRSRDLKVIPRNGNTLVVESKSDDMGSHIVRVAFLKNGEVRATCDCEWAQHRGVACIHSMAALRFLAARKGRSLSFWLDEEAARRQKNRTFQLKHTQATADSVWITSRPAS